MDEQNARSRLAALGFGPHHVETLAGHFAAAEQKGQASHGFARVEWLETLPGLNPRAEPARVELQPGWERWDGNGALGYLALAAVVDAQLAEPPDRARIVVCERTFPTGVLGLWVRRLAEHGLIGVLTATSPRRLPHPEGGPPLTGTNPLAIAIPSSDGSPFVSDVSMGAVTHGDVLTGRARPEELVPFGGEQAHKAFALAAGLQLLVDALVRGDDHGAVLLVVRPEADPVPAFRELAAGRRLPGDRG